MRVGETAYLSCPWKKPENSVQAFLITRIYAGFNNTPSMCEGVTKERADIFIPLKQAYPSREAALDNVREHLVSEMKEARVALNEATELVNNFDTWRRKTSDES